MQPTTIQISCAIILPHSARAILFLCMCVYTRHTDARVLTYYVVVSWLMPLLLLLGSVIQSSISLFVHINIVLLPGPLSIVV